MRSLRLWMCSIHLQKRNNFSSIEINRLRNFVDKDLCTLWEFNSAFWFIRFYSKWIRIEEGSGLAFFLYFFPYLLHDIVDHIAIEHGCIWYISIEKITISELIIESVSFFSSQGILIGTVWFFIPDNLCIWKLHFHGFEEFSIATSYIDKDVSFFQIQT